MEVFDASRVAMVVTDGEGNYVRVNAAFCELLGYAREEILGRSYLTFTLPDDQARDASAIDAIKTSGRVHVREKRYLRQDGGVVHARVQSLVTRDRDGRPLMALGVMEDVTELTAAQAAQREVEAALRAEQQLNRQIIDASPVGISIFAGDGACVAANAAVARIIGATPEQVKAQNFHQIASWRSSGLYDLALETQATGQPASKVIHTQTSFGREVWLAINLIALDGEGGRRLMLMINDLTDFKRAEQAQREAQENYQHLYAHSMDGILITEPGSGRVLAANPAALDMFGVDGSNLDALHRDRITDRSDPRAATARDQRASQGWFRGELRFKRASGETFDVEATSSVHHGPDGKDVASIIFRDVTERKKSEAERERVNELLEERVLARTREIALAQARTEEVNAQLASALGNLQLAQSELVRSEKLAALGALVAGVAHELNTPIGNALLAATTLSARQTAMGREVSSGLRRSVLDGFLKDVHEYAVFIEGSLGRAAELIQSFKQIAADQTSYQRRVFELSTAVHEIALSLAPTLRRGGAAIINDTQAGIELDSYPGPLGQVFINFVNNAMLHAFEGRAGGRIRFSSEFVTPGQVRVIVEDDGRGIANENLGKIFDPFFTTKLGQGGSGLGLHIVHNLVTGVLAGRVEVRSEAGKGTTFYIDLPLVAPIAPPEGSTPPVS